MTNEAEDIDAAIAGLGNSMCREVDVGGLFSRNRTAHKWKAPWRSLLLREAVAWRLQELLAQSRTLQLSGGVLGARILLRSAFETLAMLVYLNDAMRSVVARRLDFHEFSKKTTRLLLGSKDGSTGHESINILTIFSKADKVYPGLESWYAALSESAHPNHEGMILGYSTNDRENHVTHFASQWQAMYGNTHASAIRACLVVFDGEYNDAWPAAFEELETWIETNDATLESSKPRDE